MRHWLTVMATALVLGACGSILPVPTAPSTFYNLSPKSTFSQQLPEVAWQLVIEEPLAAGGLNSSSIAFRPTPLELKYFKDVRWTERVPRMVQTLLVESFENSGTIVAVGRQAIGLLRSAVAELQHSLHTQQHSASQLQANAMRHPLSDSADAVTALQQLLGAADGEELLRSAWRQLRSHQLAIQQAGNRLCDQLPVILAPAHLLGPGGPRTDGARWRALQQHYQQPGPLQQRCQHAFREAYQEQHHLLNSLHHNPFG